MDFLSNIIKRPLSLVRNESSDKTAKVSESPTSTKSSSSPTSSHIASITLPETKSDGLLELVRCDESPQKSPLRLSSPPLKNRTFSNNTTPTATTPIRRSSLSSSYHGQLSEFLDITDKLLNYEDFKEINQLDLDFETTNTGNNNNNNNNENNNPQEDSKTTTTKTIEQLLIEINENLNQAGLIDDVHNLSFSSSPHAQHSPLSASKTMLATTKSLTSASSPSVPFTSPTPTMASTCSSQPQYAERTSLTAAGAINTTEAATSAFNKYHNAPEMQAIDCHRHNKQTTDIRDLHNDGGTGSKKSLNRFASLAEFDETKIPNLPADTNIEDIEGQLKIIYDVREISKDGKLQPNLLLSNETDEAVSSDNELFTDCNEELSSGQRRDCLSSPFKEHNVNKTNDLESYYSTVNDTISASDHTLDEFSEIPMDDGQKQQYTEMNESVEPMEVDMNTTIEMMEATSSTNILFVERVLEQAERHILQHLEEEESLRAKEELALAAKTHKQSEVALPLERNSMQTGEYTVQQRLPTTLSVIKPELVGESSVTTKGVEKQEEKLLSNSTISSPKQLNITTSQYPKVSEENKTLVEHIDLNSTLVEQDLPSLHNLNFDLLKGHPEQKITFGIASTEAAANPIDNLQQTPLNSTFVQQDGHPEEKITFAPIENAVNKINNVSVPSNTIFVEQNLPSLNNLNPTFPSGNDEKRTNFNLGLIESAANAVNNQPLTLHIGSAEQNLPSFNNLNPSLPSGQAEKRRTFVIPSIENSAEVDTQEKLITDNEKQNTFSIEERMSALNTHLTVNNIETEEKGTFIEALVEEDVTKNVVMIDNEKRRRTFTAQKEIAGENRDVDVRNTEMERNLPSVSAEAAEAVECAAVDNLRAFSTQSMENKTEKDNEIVIKENRNLKDMISEKSETEELQKNNKTVSKEMISNYEAMDVDETALLPQNSSLKSSNNPEKSIHSPPVSTIKPIDQLIGQSKPALEKENLKVSKSLMSANETKNNNEIHEQNLKADTVASSSHETLTSQLIEDKHGTSMPVPKGIQKRPSIHDYKNQTEVLSAKEQSNIRVRDEKELMSEKSNSASEEIFTATSSATLSISGHSGFDTNSPNAHSSQNNSKETEQQFPEEEFQSSNNSK
uniref:Uncharacterized protein n=1 Tax=Glossina brevipalpis TaxID=37001 RepID=A0A1A9WS02_9MUSC